MFLFFLIDRKIITSAVPVRTSDVVQTRILKVLRILNQTSHYLPE